MKRLDTTIKANGHMYELVRRSLKVALYSQHLQGDDSLVGYELFTIPKRSSESINGIEYPERETYPNSSRWGVDAFTLSYKLSKQEAIERFEKYSSEIENNN